MGSLSGKNAVVTGSTSGIGLAYARAFAGAGANVVINGFSPLSCAVSGSLLVSGMFGFIVPLLVRILRGQEQEAGRGVAPVAELVPQAEVRQRPPPQLEHARPPALAAGRERRKRSSGQRPSHPVPLSMR